MKKPISLAILFLFVGTIYAQKVKLKKGKVLIDKKDYISYQDDAFSSLNGIPLFSLKRESIEVENPLKNQYNTGQSSRRADRYNKKKKIRYTLVKFTGFDLEYETTLSVSKILKVFYNEKLIQESGKIDPKKARAIAFKMYKDITGKRGKIKL